MRIDLKDVRDGDVLQPFGFVYESGYGFLVEAEADKWVISAITASMIAAAPDAVWIERPDKPSQLEFDTVVHNDPDAEREPCYIVNRMLNAWDRQPVTVIVRPLGEPLELPCTVDGLWTQPDRDALRDFLARYNLKCKESQ